MSLSPEQIRATAPEIRYLLVRRDDFSEPNSDGTARLVRTNPIAKQLFIDAEPPPGFTLLRTVYEEAAPPGPNAIVARLYKIEPKVD